MYGKRYVACNQYRTQDCSSTFQVTHWSSWKKESLSEIKKHNWITFSEFLIKLTSVSEFSCSILNQSHHHNLLEFLDSYIKNLFIMFSNRIYTTFYFQSWRHQGVNIRLRRKKCFWVGFCVGFFFLIWSTFRCFNI